MDVETAGSETSPRFSEALAVKVREGAKSTGPDEREKDEETRADVFWWCRLENVLPEKNVTVVYRQLTLNWHMFVLS